MRMPSSRVLATVAAPALLLQARHVRRQIPRLPEAAGARAGAVGSPDAAGLSIVVIGESTAVGVGATTLENALAGHVARTLAHLTGQRVSWTAVGRSGATARDVVHEVVPHVKGVHDLAVAVLGVNDTLALTGPRAWRAVVEELLDALQPHVQPTGRIVLAGIPAVGRFTALPQPLRSVLGRHASTLDGVLGDLAGERAPRVLHVRTPVLGSGPMQAVDRFHPSALGYELWGANLAREVLAEPALT